MMKNICIVLIYILISACSTSRKQVENTDALPSSEKKLTVLSKEYPGIFSIEDSYSHLPPEEKERDSIIFACSTGKAAETIKKLFSEMRDATKTSVHSYYIATCYYINKDYHRALHYFSKVYTASTDLSLKNKALANMATIQWELGKYRKAIAYWRESYQQKNNPTTLFLLTNAELELGLFKKIVDRKSELAKYNFTDSLWKLLVAECAFFTSDYDKAVATYETLTEDFWKKQKNAQVNYIVSLYKTGRHDAAKNFVAKWKSSLAISQPYQTAKNLYPEIIKYE